LSVCVTTVKFLSEAVVPPGVVTEILAFPGLAGRRNFDGDLGVIDRPLPCEGRM
jgi:hypothetical protein